MLNLVRSFLWLQKLNAYISSDDESSDSGFSLIVTDLEPGIDPLNLCTIGTEEKNRSRRGNL